MLCMEQVEYQLPALDAQGNRTGQMRGTVFKKTIFDSNFVSGEDMVGMGREAADSALAANGGTLPREWSGLTSGGIPMRGYTTDGIVTSFYPEIN